MELKECKTCGSHNFTDNKCDYCGNEYEVAEYYANDKQVKESLGKVWCDDEIETYAQDFRDYMNGTEVTELDFQETLEGKMLLKIMIWVLVSIIWFAVTVFIPPLFIITIIGLIILVCKKACKKY